MKKPVKLTTVEKLWQVLALNEEMFRELDLMRIRMDVLDRWLKYKVGAAAHAQFEAEVAAEIERKRVVGNVIKLRAMTPPTS